MFEDVWNSCRIGRVRFECDGKGIVLVISCDMKVIGARLVMVEMERC